MKTCILLLSFTAILISCGNNSNKNKENGPDVLSNYYKDITLPFVAYDSLLSELGSDSILPINIFNQVFSDTIFKAEFKNNKKYKLYPVGKIVTDNSESYYLTLAKDNILSALYISVYDSGKHMISMPLIVKGNDTLQGTYSATIDKKLSITINNEWMVKSDPYYRRIIYAYNNVGVFTTVLTETNEQRRAETSMINPLDTFPKKSKFSGDYSKGSSNKMFIRDASTAGEYLFYIHFQKTEEDDVCNGEVRGTFKMIDAETGIYTKPGDPCELTFTFKGGKVNVKENGSCGNYRDIKCFFNDDYIKKKEPKINTTKKSK